MVLISVHRANSTFHYKHRPFFCSLFREPDLRVERNNHIGHTITKEKIYVVSKHKS